MCYCYRRSYSLDVEVSASGFTKDLERDCAFLHPAGPDEDDEDEGDYEEATDLEGEREEESVDMEEYKHAMLELEGLKVSDTHANVRGEQEETEREPIATSDGDTQKDTEEELKEAEDECPELSDLSASNKEFKPFR